MEVLFILARLPTIRSKESLPELLRILQQVFDILTHKKLQEPVKMQLLWLFEAGRVLTYLLLRYGKESRDLLEDRVPPPKALVKEFCTLLRPCLYLLAMMYWGRKHLLPFLVSAGLELVSEPPAWPMYIFRYPVFDLLQRYVLPKKLHVLFESYTRHLSYTL